MTLITFDKLAAPQSSSVCELVWKRLIGAAKSGSTQSDGERVHSALWGLAVALYRPGGQRLLVVRRRQSSGPETIDAVVNGLQSHPRFAEFEPWSAASVRLQVDVICDGPQPVEFETLSENSLGADRFEFGVDGLRIIGGSQTRYFLPGDTFVKSVLGLSSGTTTRTWIGR